VVSLFYPKGTYNNPIPFVVKDSLIDSIAAHLLLEQVDTLFDTVAQCVKGVYSFLLFVKRQNNTGIISCEVLFSWGFIIYWNLKFAIGEFVFW